MGGTLAKGCRPFYYHGFVGSANLNETASHLRKGKVVAKLTLDKASETINRTAIRGVFLFSPRTSGARGFYRFTLGSAFLFQNYELWKLRPILRTKSP